MKAKIILALCEILSIKPEWLYYDSKKTGHILRKKPTKKKITNILEQILSELGITTLDNDLNIIKKDSGNIVISIQTGNTKKQITLRSSRIDTYIKPITYIEFQYTDSNTHEHKIVYRYSLTDKKTVYMRKATHEYQYGNSNQKCKISYGKKEIIIELTNRNHPQTRETLIANSNEATYRLVINTKEEIKSTDYLCIENEDSKLIQILANALWQEGKISNVASSIDCELKRLTAANKMPKYEGYTLTVTARKSEYEMLENSKKVAQVKGNQHGVTEILVDGKPVELPSKETKPNTTDIPPRKNCYNLGKRVKKIKVKRREKKNY